MAAGLSVVWLLTFLAHFRSDGSWEQFFVGALPEKEQEGVLVVMNGTCEEKTELMSFHVSGKGTLFLADSDLHDPRFDNMRRDFDFSANFVPDDNFTSDPADNCAYYLSIYPTEEYADQYFSDFPIIYAVLVITCFLIATLCFAMYDILVQRRQRKLLETAQKTSAIVSSLFPSNVRDRLLEELNTPAESTERMMKPKLGSMQRSRHRNNSLSMSSSHNRMMRQSSFAGLGMNSFGMEDVSSAGSGGIATSEIIFGSKPIADLFPSTTISKLRVASCFVMSERNEVKQAHPLCSCFTQCLRIWLVSSFQDASVWLPQMSRSLIQLILFLYTGFTAWSSTREPTAVFTLLETVYHSFDSIAKRRKVFKVETVGDCYGESAAKAYSAVNGAI